MFAGHIGVALTAARVEPRLNVGILTAASLLLDLLLWLFVILGWETVVIPVNFPLTHQPEFVFPYSHSLVASAAWSAIAGALILLLHRSRAREQLFPAALVASIVFSHWLLDALVHRPELPVAGASSPQLGLGLWNSMPIALIVEGALVMVGLVLFLRGSGLSWPKKLAIAALSVLALVFTVVGMTVAPPPPSSTAMAASSLATIVLVCGLIGWLGSSVRARQA